MMHLTDEQLIARDDVNDLHLAECEHCRLKAEKLAGIRQQLQKLPTHKLPVDLWPSVKQAELTERRKHQLESSEKRAKFWQISSFALAASLLVTGVWVGVFQSSNSQVDGGLAEQVNLLIDQNKELQLQLKSRSGRELEGNFEFNRLTQELDKLDARLQRVYMQPGNLIEKNKLWSMRKILLVELNLISKDRHSIESDKKAIRI
ncbi:MAG: hypothetical protein OQK04_00750 [Kangiellaceae bacterium]|nr:hypothetical protein [Kangiellaceae bacterium]MCW8997228.1 hypothetical protein [Kangiellaceae bacterium]